MDPTAHESFTEHVIPDKAHVGGHKPAKAKKELGTDSAGKQRNGVDWSAVSLWIYEFLKDWIATLAIGFLVVSYWRGSWVLLDLYTCNQPQDASLLNGDSFCFGVDTSNPTRVTSAWATYIVGYALFVVGVSLTWAGWWIPRKPQSLAWKKVAQRIFIVYVLGAATVNIWRSIWYLTDHLILPSAPLTSWWITLGCGLAGAFLILGGPSLLAPPAIFNMDGPAVNPPPIAVTILSSYYSITLSYDEEPPDVPKIVQAVDVFLSFTVLPIFVVWFWRGCWFVLDQYLWGFTSDVQGVYGSLGYGTALAIGLLFLGSDDVVVLVPSSSFALNQLTGRTRVVILAVGTVNFWRVVWLIWDEFFGGTTYWSAWLSHVLGVVGLVVMGCFACITAPPSTLGVDAVAGEDSADEPLFHDVPIPAETIFWFAIARKQTLPVESSASEPEKPTSLLQRQRPDFAKTGSARVHRNDLQSLTTVVLNQRNAEKRKNNQFFRSR